MAQWNGVKEYKAAGKSVVTSCTSLPLPHKTYCQLHDGEQSPVVDSVSSRTRKALKNYWTQTNYCDKASDDQIFIIELILDINKENGEEMFKVKWYGFPEDQATIEPSKYIPKFIQNYYNDETKFGKTLPNPRIKHKKKITDGTNYHFLSWVEERREDLG